MKLFEKLTIVFAQFAFRPRENAVILALKANLEAQLNKLAPELQAIKPDVDGRIWRITYHPIYKQNQPRKLGNQIALTAVIACHTYAENRALADMMKAGRSFTWRGHKRSDIMSRAFAINGYPYLQPANAPALELVHETVVNNQIVKRQGHGVSALVADIERHVRHESNLVGWQGFSYDVKRALLLATGQTHGRKHRI